MGSIEPDKLVDFPRRGAFRQCPFFWPAGAHTCVWVWAFRPFWFGFLLQQLIKYSSFNRNKLWPILCTISVAFGGWPACFCGRTRPGTFINPFMGTAGNSPDYNGSNFALCLGNPFKSLATNWDLQFLHPPTYSFPNILYFSFGKVGKCNFPHGWRVMKMPKSKNSSFLRLRVLFNKLQLS